jgi:hypothetical protein
MEQSGTQEAMQYQTSEMTSRYLDKTGTCTFVYSRNIRPLNLPTERMQFLEKRGDAGCQLCRVPNLESARLVDTQTNRTAGCPNSTRRD